MKEYRKEGRKVTEGRKEGRLLGREGREVWEGRKEGRTDKRKERRK